jgi:hypothetical protein
MKPPHNLVSKNSYSADFEHSVFAQITFMFATASQLPIDINVSGGWFATEPTI